MSPLFIYCGVNRMDDGINQYLRETKMIPIPLRMARVRLAAGRAVAQISAIIRSPEGPEAMKLPN